MVTCLNQQWVSRCRALVRGACLVSAGGGVFLFSAWLFDLRFLRNVPFDLTTTTPATAVGFILAGIALWCLQDAQPGVRFRVGRIAAILVAILGGLALVEIALDWTLRVDRLAATVEAGTKEALAASFFDLTGPATALSFVLLGLAWMFLDVQTRNGGWPVQILVLVTATVSLLATAGYYYGPDDLHQVAALTATKFSSVFLIFLLCAGTLCSRPERGITATFISDQLGGLLMRRLLPAVIVVPLLMGWLQLFGERLGLYHLGFGLALFATVLILSFIGLLWWCSAVVNRLDAANRRTTERLHKSNDQLRRDMTFFRGIAETVPGILFVWNADGKNIFACPNFYELTGLPHGSAEGDGWADALHPADRERMMEAWHEALKSGRSLDIKHRLRLAHGNDHWAIMRACAMRDGNGALVSWFGFCTDIDEQQQTEEKLEAAVAERTIKLQERADQLSRLASDLTLTEQRERRRLAQVLHDNLQQLLVGAKFNLNVLSRRVGEKESDQVAEVEKLVNESIAVSRSLTLELSPPILHEAGLVAGMEWLARWLLEKQGLTVDLKIDPALVVEREDLRVLIFEAVRELLLNVVKHAQVDRVEVQITIEDNREIRAVVEDHGIGFEGATVFNGSREVDSGFGLFNVRERLNLTGGQVEIDSTPGEGTRIVISVPFDGILNASGDKKDDPIESNGESNESKDQERLDEATVRLLLVDDHDVVRQGLAALLSAEKDIRIIGEAKDGEAGVELARLLEPDIVLMDFSMPKLDGVQATRLIHEEMPRIAIIGLSMYEQADRESAMMAAGASAYLSKAGTSEALVDAIRENVRRKRETRFEELPKFK